MATNEAGGAREWASRVVQWNAPRAWIKYGVHAAARARGSRLARRGDLPEIANIFTAGSPKAGSQWMKALFDHPVVRSHTGLFTLPQLDYQQRLDKTIPAGTFVPGIYMSHDEYERFRRPWPHRTVYMFRDPRDLLVSGYYSAVKTHRKTHLREVEELRERLRAMPADEGLLTLIRYNKERLEEIASWADVDDPAVMSFRLEDNDVDPRGQVDAMLRHCGVELSTEELEVVVGDVSREALQVKDLADRQDGESHYRVERTTFRDHFDERHYAALEAIAPGLAERLGYPAN